MENDFHVIVDVARVTFVDSVTLSSLTAAAKQVRVGGGSFRVDPSLR
jgi:anti-anti-sigma regulatory factor